MPFPDIHVHDIFEYEDKTWMLLLKEVNQIGVNLFDIDHGHVESFGLQKFIDKEVKVLESVTIIPRERKEGVLVPKFVHHPGLLIGGDPVMDPRNHEFYIAIHGYPRQNMLRIRDLSFWNILVPKLLLVPIKLVSASFRDECFEQFNPLNPFIQMKSVIADINEKATTLVWAMVDKGWIQPDEISSEIQKVFGFLAQASVTLDDAIKHFEHEMSSRVA